MNDKTKLSAIEEHQFLRTVIEALEIDIPALEIDIPTATLRYYVERYLKNYKASPGKFEGEPAYVKFYWHYLLEGGSREILGDGDLLDIEPGEQELFGIEPHHCYILVLWDDAGFVYHRLLTREEYDEESALGSAEDDCFHDDQSRSY